MQRIVTVLHWLDTGNLFIWNICQEDTFYDQLEAPRINHIVLYRNTSKLGNTSSHWTTCSHLMARHWCHHDPFLFSSALCYCKPDLFPQIQAYSQERSLPKLYEDLWNFKFWILGKFLCFFFCGGKGAFNMGANGEYKSVISWNPLVVERTNQNLGVEDTSNTYVVYLWPNSVQCHFWVIRAFASKRHVTRKWRVEERNRVKFETHDY